MRKRDRLEIVHDMLNVISQYGPIKPTHLLYKSNLSYAMLSEYVKELQERGFVEEQEVKQKKSMHKRYVITDSGLQFLDKFRQIKEFSEGFGL